jgi:hypothetical protein
LREVGTLGRVTQVLIAVASLFFVLSWIIEFAIVGTLYLGLGLVCLSVCVMRWRLLATTDRVLIILSAVGSLTWNTETVSAFLLVGVAILWMILSIRLLPPSGKRESWNPRPNSKASRNITKSSPTLLRKVLGKSESPTSEIARADAAVARDGPATYPVFGLFGVAEGELEALALHLATGADSPRLVG